MVYELEVVTEESVKIRKLKELPQWGSELHFESLPVLLTYLSDYVSLITNEHTLSDLLHAAPMETWLTFE